MSGEKEAGYAGEQPARDNQSRKQAGASANFAEAQPVSFVFWQCLQKLIL